MPKSNKQMMKEGKELLAFIKDNPKEAKQLGFGEDDVNLLQKSLASLGLDLQVPDIGKVPNILNKTVQIHNKIRGKKKDPRDIKLKKGEKHALFKNKEGALARAVFCGPGTEIVDKIKRLAKKHGNDPKKIIDKMNFVSEADIVCMAHDLRYFTQGKNTALVRRADEIMLKNLKRMEDEGKESKFNIKPSQAGIKAKVKLEDMGIMRKGSFAEGEADEKLKDDPETRKLINAILGELNKRGYGQYGGATDEDVKKAENEMLKLALEQEDLYAFEGYYRNELNKGNDLNRSSLKSQWKRNKEGISESEYNRFIKLGKAKKWNPPRKKDEDDESYKIRTKEIRDRIINEVDEWADKNFDKFLDLKTNVLTKRLENAGNKWSTAVEKKNNLKKDKQKLKDTVKILLKNNFDNLEIDELSIKELGQMRNQLIKEGVNEELAREFINEEKAKRRKGGEIKERPTRKPANAWVQHVKRYAMEHDVSYREALKQAGATYRKN